MSEKQCKQLWPGRSLGATTIRLQTYAKQPLAVLGSLDVQVVYEQEKVTLPLIIVEGNGPTLFGRNWFNVIKVNWPNIHYTRAPGLQDTNTQNCLSLGWVHLKAQMSLLRWILKPHLIFAKLDNYRML